MMTCCVPPKLLTGLWRRFWDKEAGKIMTRDE